MPVSMDRYAPGLIKLSLQDAPPEQASREAAIGIGRHAARLGWSEKELSNWLSSNYGRVWVKETALKPGLDFKDVRKYTLQAFRKAERKIAQMSATKKQRLVTRIRALEEGDGER